MDLSYNTSLVILLVRGTGQQRRVVFFSEDYFPAQVHLERYESEEFLFVRVVNLLEEELLFFVVGLLSYFDSNYKKRYVIWFPAC